MKEKLKKFRNGCEVLAMNAFVTVLVGVEIVKFILMLGGVFVRVLINKARRKLAKQ